MVLWTRSREDTKVAEKSTRRSRFCAHCDRRRAAPGVIDICREHGVSEATFYVWQKKYAGLGLNELRELLQPREENSKLTRREKSCKASPAA